MCLYSNKSLLTTTNGSLILSYINYENNIR